MAPRKPKRAQKAFEQETVTSTSGSQQLASAKQVKQEERHGSTDSVPENSGQTTADHLDRVKAAQAPAPAAAGPSTAPELAFDRELSNAEVAKKASAVGSTTFTEEEVALVRDKPSMHQPWEIREVLKPYLMVFRKAAVKEAKEKEAKRRRDEAEAGASKRVKS